LGTKEPGKAFKIKLLLKKHITKTRRLRIAATM
jgi:hypothetical protein